jgi:diguanylate cyclase (GGDEF)-like protein
VLVFEQLGEGFSLVGGSGRGAGWAGIVDLPPDGTLVSRAWRAGTLAWLDGTRPAQVAGPYYARHAVAVPVGDRHVVVLGSRRTINLREPEAVRIAAAAVDRSRGVPADKLLADELELVHAIRALMAYRPDNVHETLHHIATIAASALSCEHAVIRVVKDGEPITTAIGPEAASPAWQSRIAAQLDTVAASGRPVVEQSNEASGMVLGSEVASYLMLPIGSDSTFGAIALVHSTTNARGFTSLCQRIGRAVADAAELLITQATAREQLAAERDLLARISATDSLTALANRRAWEAEAERVLAHPGGQTACVLSCDLDGLKAVNDRYGHAAGDALIRAAAGILSSSVRGSDLVARIGGDEFVVLLRGADRAVARVVLQRIRRAERAWQVTDNELRPRLSVGWACVTDNDIEVARCAADTMMYANKRRRANGARPSAASPAA